MDGGVTGITISICLERYSGEEWRDRKSRAANSRWNHNWRGKSVRLAENSGIRWLWEQLAHKQIGWPEAQETKLTKETDRARAHCSVWTLWKLNNQREQKEGINAAVLIRGRGSGVLLDWAEGVTTPPTRMHTPQTKLETWGGRNGGRGEEVLAAVGHSSFVT